MNFANLPNEAAAARWHLIFMLLSMEKTAQFWSDMGLLTEQTPALREIAQSFVRKYRRIEENTSLSTKERLTQYQELFQETFERIVHEVNQEAAEIIYKWGINTFQHDPNMDAQAFLWLFLLRRLAGVSGLSFPLIPLKLPAQELEAVKSMVVNHLADFAEIKRRLSEAEQEPLSPWEEQIYRTYTGGASPMDWVESTIVYVKFRATWLDIAKLLGKAELEILLEWGKKQAEAMEMPSELIGLPNFTDSVEGA
jgi:hypothetical protein